MNNNLLFNVLIRTIERGDIEGFFDKIDIFLAANKLTKEQYLQLTAMIA